MKNTSVRCWEIENYRKGIKDVLYITYPDGFGGHSFIVCLSCGKIYAVDVEGEMYVMPLTEKLKNMRCINCGKDLLNNYAYYPETYVVDGNVYHHQRSQEIPPDETSITKEFPGIYE